MVSLDRDLLIDHIWHNYISGKNKIIIYGINYNIFHGIRDGTTEIFCDSDKYRILLVIPFNGKSFLVISRHLNEEIIYEDSGEEYIPENIFELIK